MPALTVPRRSLLAAACAAGLGALLAGCGSSAPAARAPAAAAPSTAGAASASPKAARQLDPLAYVDEATYRAHKADYAGRKVALFFWASWCPNCQAHDLYLRNTLQAGVFPRNLTIVKVDYDVRTDLEQKYGVTQQDTFVPVDLAGKALRAPLVSPPASDILGLAA